MPVRDIDHVVIMTRDLAAARRAWEELGFTTTPRAVHPFGTANSLVQMDGNFVELLEIDDPARIPAPSGSFFSFAAHNRDFLADRGEGASMLVLTSDDRDADLAAWRDAGLRTYDPVDFERQAGLPDGSSVRVAFSLGFAASDALAGLGFFVCQQHTPEAFWKPQYQTHANGARRIVGMSLTSPVPASAAGFLEAFSGGTAGSAGEDGAIAVALDRDRLSVRPGSPPAMPAMTIAVADLDAAARHIPGASRDGDAILVPAERTPGLSLRLVAA